MPTTSSPNVAALQSAAGTWDEMRLLHPDRASPRDYAELLLTIKHQDPVPVRLVGKVMGGDDSEPLYKVETPRERVRIAFPEELSRPRT